jgi:transcriptional regulator with XRE-family HTH domain
MTQEELAERSGISVRAIADAETGRTRQPHRSSVDALARALGLAPHEQDRLLAAAQGTIGRDGPG